MDLSAIAALPKQQLALIPAGFPPNGTIPTFINPPSDGYQFIVVGTILQTLMLTACILRLKTNYAINKGFASHDWMCLIAMIGTTFYFISGCVSVTLGRIGTHNWDVSLEFIFSDTFIISSFFVNFLTACVWVFVKLTFFFFYLHIFRPKRYLRYAIWVGIVVNIIFHIVVISMTLAFIAPGPHQTWLQGFISKRYSHVFDASVPIAAGSLVLDVYILIIPIIGLWDLQMSLKRKLAVMSVFATGISACVCSSLSLYFKEKQYRNNSDFLYEVLPVIIASHAEMCIGLCAACMPALSNIAKSSPWFKQFNSRIWSLISSLRTSSRSKASSISSQNEKSIILQGKTSSNSRKVQQVGLGFNSTGSTAKYVYDDSQSSTISERDV